jgi:hypothetical protein
MNEQEKTNLPNTTKVLPKDYTIISDEKFKTYTLKFGDYFKLEKDKTWEKVSGYAGWNTKEAFGNQIHEGKYIVAIYNDKPRFKSKKPYPFGY